jgi:hypothetical protein
MDTGRLTPGREGAAGTGRRLQGNGVPLGSDDPDVLGFFALATGSNVELDVLALIEGLVTGALDVGVVHENVISSSAGDEAEALLSVEELDGACSQFILFSYLEVIRLTPSL